MDFIFMLTHKDKTVPNCLDVMAEIADLGLKHVGFKDVGVDISTLKQLAKAITASGAISYVEVVSTTAETIKRSIAAAAELGVDRVLGGQDIAFAQSQFKGKGVGYYPFPGRPEGHPTRLGGRSADIERYCVEARKLGCPGVDLLAYRAFEDDPLQLVRAARKGLGADGYLIVAGSIDSTERIRAIDDAGADAFTIGSAIFEESFAPGVKGLKGQCEAVLKSLGQ
jgi:hypothetical protein